MAKTLLRGAAAALALFSAGCGLGGKDHDVFYDGASPLEPTAGAWATWIVGDVAALRPPAPELSSSGAKALEMDALRARAAARGPAETSNIDFWNGGTCRRWNEYQRSLIISRKPPPPKAARGLALASMALHDAVVAAWDAKFAYLEARPSALADPPAVYGPEPDCPSYVSERAAISAAAAAVLNYLFPADATATNALRDSALSADLDACISFPSDVDAGRALGEAVAALVLARAASDHGDDPQPAYTSTGLPGRWSPTPPGFASPPVLPGWGSVATFLIEDGSALRPPPPPAYGSNEWNSQRDEVLFVNLTLTPERKAIADFWADGGGTATPPGHWNQIAVDLAVSGGMNEPRTARMLSYLGAAQHDAFVACWDCKYFYDVERPVGAIRRDVAGQSTWLPYVVTPPFPSYPSGHSSTSGAASAVLGYFFPASALDLALQASEARDSRIYGGIHYSFDNDTGFDLGRTIGTLAVERAGADGAP